MLEFKNLLAEVANKSVLNEFNWQLQSGQLHVLMGPNGSGKSSMAAVLMGHPDYKIVSGEIWWEGENLLNLSPDARFKKGLFLAFQSPRSIPGLKVFNFLKAIYESKYNSKIDILEFEKQLHPLFEAVGLHPSFMYRDVNVGFSGGERKRFEILQLLLTKPRLIVIDEIDSGLDVDALRLIAKLLCDYRQQNPDVTMILITHYQRILEYLAPDLIHILNHGKLLKTGGMELVKQIELGGYTA